MKKFDINFCNKISNRKIYYGLSILKALLAFDVINTHCFNKNSTSNKAIIYLLKSTKLHVPSFIIMSFYFTHNILTNFDINKINKRFERLLIPYIGWPLILVIMSNFIHYFFKQYYQYPFKILIYQLILGDAPNIPLHFWFLFDLIITSILFLIIIKIMKHHYLFILELLMIFSYFLQYSKLNLKFYYYVNMKVSLGKENEFLPFAITGFFLFELNIIEKLQKYKIYTFIISLIILNYSFWLYLI